MDQFTFEATGTDQLTFTNEVMDPGEIVTMNVKYSPTRAGTAYAILEATWDSAGVKTFTGTTLIEATGVLLRNVFSVENVAAAAQPYSVETGEFFTVPIRITDNIEDPADVRGATFTVSYRGDLMHFAGSVQNPTEGLVLVNGFGDARVISGPTPPDVDGYESVTIHVNSTGGDILNASELVQMRFQLMITTVEQSDIIVSNGVFTDAAEAPLCYFVNSYIPAQFVPIDRCGDNVVRTWLRGTKPTSISYLNPNPAVPGSDLTLGYRVNVPLAPVTVEIFDVLGDKVRTLQSAKTSAKGDHSLVIATDGLAAGVYTVRLSGGEWSETTNFVIEK
jgi:hypothetical protein